ncbi:MAG: glycosyltransferase family 2 protein [Planctomycetes bacterium]|nr:glycosyltransferase family 2 protein [Planctomycetota bacterium]
MSQRPLVSAIVPTFRRPHLLQRSLGSVLAQTWRPLELVVVDDESQDNTPQVLQDFAAQAKAADVAFQWFTKPNGGPGLARNFGMQRAKGDYFAFLDDDDSWFAKKLERQIARMQQDPKAGAGFTQYVHHGKTDQPKPAPRYMQEGWVFAGLCAGNTRAHIQTLMITRQAFELTGGFGTNFQWEDTEFELRLSLHVPFLALQEPLTEIMTVPDSISRQAGLEGDLRRDRIKLGLLDELIANQGRHERFDLSATKLLRARIYDEHIKHLIWLGQVAQARATLQEALAACGAQEVLHRLRGKLLRARVAGWFGRKLKKP